MNIGHAKIFGKYLAFVIVIESDGVVMIVLLFLFLNMKLQSKSSFFVSCGKIVMILATHTIFFLELPLKKN